MIHLQALQIRIRTSPHSTLTVNSSSNAAQSCDNSIVVLRCLFSNCLWRKLCINKKDKKRHSTEMLQWEHLVTGKEHVSFARHFPCLLAYVTTSRPRDPGVVSLHLNAGYLIFRPRRYLTYTWGPPPPCQQVLKSIKICTMWGTILQKELKLTTWHKVSWQMRK